MAELLKMTPRPALNGLSIGYRAKDFELHYSGPIKRTLKAADLVECSLVTFPADKFVRVASVKSGFDTEPESPTMTIRELAWLSVYNFRNSISGNRRTRSNSCCVAEITSWEQVALKSQTPSE